MATTLSSFSLSLPPLARKPSNPSSLCLFAVPRFDFSRKNRSLILTAAASPSSDHFSSNRDDGFSLDDFALNSDSRSPNPSKKCLLIDLIQEIEPLDVSLIQKDVPPTTLDAMKRTISGMLGLLPSDRFQVHIDSLWEPLSKLLVSSMMTGYTLRNAEYRLFLEKNLDMNGGNSENQTSENAEYDFKGISLDDAETSEQLIKNLPETIDKEGLGRIPPEAQQYILRLQSQLSSVKKELQETKRKNAALQMQQFVGEEKNDLLDYLRSLQPEKVAELSEPTSPEVKETIHCVVHGLLATLSPKMHSKLPESEGPPAETVKAKSDEDCAELVENTSIQFQPLISLTRDYLARLLFWCMLLGHYLRGLEYRMELMEVLSLASDTNGSDVV
ncbi:PREDICTED: uncharacterized protein LOC104819546 [Tarenaya hassleriana]|uniref:uncharacterized protein LOC104819546 n=1 Tax=Tarenaya hassleriana TaxID=28532 RepID=UPI00053C96B5|nr:PREDICTED: uncharacterized protein LOC104819546 [Tarenaya hassleriana]